MIVYPAKNEKHVVTVFIDISCHYCHLLHQQIKEYNELGITVRYLAFPRAGLNSQNCRPNGSDFLLRKIAYLH